MAQNGRAEATIIKAQYFLRQLKPGIGKRPIDKIEPFEILAILKRLEAQGKHETAKKCRSFASRVFRYAAATTRCSTDPTTLLQVRSSNQSPAIMQQFLILKNLEAYCALPKVMMAICSRDMPYWWLPMFLFAPVSYGMRNGTKLISMKQFGIPPGKLKSRRMHAVPLSRQVVSLLEGLSSYIGSEGYIFPFVRSFKRPMSENTLNAAFRRMGFGKDEVTAHGLRATASTLLNECGLWNPDAIERSLAHGDSNAVRGVYHRGLPGKSESRWRNGGVTILTNYAKAAGS